MGKSITSRLGHATVSGHPGQDDPADSFVHKSHVQVGSKKRAVAGLFHLGCVGCLEPRNYLGPLIPLEQKTCSSLQHVEGPGGLVAAVLSGNDIDREIRRVRRVNQAVRSVNNCSLTLGQSFFIKESVL